MKQRCALLLFLCMTVITSGLAAIDIKKNNLEINLNEPVYHDGVLTTTRGGTIKGEDFFLQATVIEYTRKIEKKTPIQTIVAHGNLFFIYRGHPYVGDEVTFDLITRKSTITNGCTTEGPWFVGGKKILLEADGTGAVINGYMTTSENERSDWSMAAPLVQMKKGGVMHAKNVGFFFIRLPFFWIPSYSTTLRKSHSSPIKYQFRAGGRLGPRVGMSYTFLKKRRMTATILTDIILRRGIGAGIHTQYQHPVRQESLQTHSYVAHDMKAESLHEALRYRFLGAYSRTWPLPGLHLDATYDKLSDIDMRSDYMNQGFDATDVLPTRACLSKDNENWLRSLNCRIRANEFQTIKEELPLLQCVSHPFVLTKYNFVLANNFSAGYLNYLYANTTPPDIHPYHSTRVELGQNLYRNFWFYPFMCTPQVGYTFIAYNNSPQNVPRYLLVGKAGCEIHTRFIHPLRSGFDAIEPYAQYDVVTDPAVPPDQHYLFDINDGYHRMNAIRFGLRNFLERDSRSGFTRKWDCDLYTRAFFDTPTVGNPIPVIYATTRWKPTPFTEYSATFGWDRNHQMIDHYSVRGAFTVSEDIAFTVEWRHRSQFCWRKLDPDNFMLESFRTIDELRNSELSDRRNTLITGLFLRLSPKLTCELKTRHGSGRLNEKRYNAYEINFTTLIRGALTVRFSWQKRTRQAPRYSIDFDINLDRPRSITATPGIGCTTYAN